MPLFAILFKNGDIDQVISICLTLGKVNPIWKMVLGIRYVVRFVWGHSYFLTWRTF